MTERLPPFGPADKPVVWQEYYRRQARVPDCPKPFAKLDGTWHLPPWPPPWYPADWRPLSPEEIAEGRAAARDFLAHQTDYHTPGAANRPATRTELRRAGERAAAQARKRRKQRESGQGDSEPTPRQSMLL